LFLDFVDRIQSDAYSSFERRAALMEN